MCPSIDEWIKKIWHIYAMECYSVIKKNEIRSFTGKWVEVEVIMLSEINQMQKDKYCVFPFLYGS
jgi:hypothetical protein